MCMCMRVSAEAASNDFEGMLGQLEAWLGDQWDTAWKCLSTNTPLNFLEVYAGEARATHAVNELGGLGIRLGAIYDAERWCTRRLES
jgi:hypothetical protein